MAEELNFNESYEKITTKTPVHADNLNKIFDLLLENDKFLKYTAESIAEKMLEKGMIANNLVTDNAEMVLAAPMGKELKRQLDEQNNNIHDRFPQIANGVKGQGWYRFAKFQCDQKFDAAQGSTGNSVLIVIKSAFTVSGNICDFILLNSAYQRSDFTVLGSKHAGNIISKVRHTIDTTNKVSYLEFFYGVTSDSYANKISIDLYSVEDGNQYYKWELMDYEPTQETLENVLVYSSANLENKDRNVVTNSDLPKLYYRIEDTQNAGNPTEAIKNKWATMPDGNYICEIYVGSVHTALIQKIENGNYGSVYIISYGLATPLYIRKELESWIIK